MYMRVIYLEYNAVIIRVLKLKSLERDGSDEFSAFKIYCGS